MHFLLALLFCLMVFLCYCAIPLVASVLFAVLAFRDLAELFRELREEKCH
jgi:hypothetical protein